MSPSPSRLERVAGWILPWVAFLAFLVWAWGPRDLFRTIPHYGDALETAVLAPWVSDSLATGRNPLIYPLNYFPEGWRVGSHSMSILLYVLLAPLARLGGGAFFYNVGTLLACLIGFAGALSLARRHLPAFPAAVVALAMTFWGMHWSETVEGRLNYFLAASLLPWMLWGVERAFAAPWRRRYLWLFLVGVVWAFLFNLSLYFVFLGGVLLGLWMLLSPALGGKAGGWKRRLSGLCFVIAVFLVLSAPWLILNVRETALVDSPPFSIAEVDFSGASLNSLPIPFLSHPWLASFARSIYRGEPWEQGTANLGLAWSIVALAGAWLGRRHRAWLPALAVAAVCLMLAMGLTLHWDGRTVQWPPLRPLNRVIWQVGHALKPAFFVDSEPSARFADAVPLPGLLLAVFVPLWEQARVFARYALAASLGVYLLAGMALAQVRRTQVWPSRPLAGLVIQVVLAAVLLFEIVPSPLSALPFPPEGHPAYTWLSQQALNGAGIANVFAAHPSTLVLSNMSYNLLAPSYHKQATLSGITGVRPRYNAQLNEWLATHEHPFWHPDLAPILRSYRVKYILMEMQGEWEGGLWQEARAAKEIKPLECFPGPPSGSTTPWNWPICVLEVLPSPSPDFNVLLHDGWSGMEGWGVWAEGTRSDIQFVVTSRSPVRLELAAFPLCVPGKQQRISLAVNGTEVAVHEWSDCEPWNAAADIPAALVQVGFNDLTVRAAYAELPPQAGGSDPRKLSVGFSRLRVGASP